MRKARLIHVDIGKETISATPEHPFWVQGIGWVDATGLSAGDDLLLADGGTATIVSVMRERLESPRDVYNFEVEGFHTYFVASAGVWVHNACAARIERHHTIPTQVLKELRKAGKVGKEWGFVYGKRGAPNRLALPKPVHRSLHSGPLAKQYNTTVIRLVNKYGGYGAMTPQRMAYIRKVGMRAHNIHRY